MATKHSEMVRVIQSNVDYLNKKLGTNYCVNYAAHYGGWEFYECGEHGEHTGILSPGASRLTDDGMWQYLQGIFAALRLFGK